MGGMNSATEIITVVQGRSPADRIWKLAEGPWFNPTWLDDPFHPVCAGFVRGLVTSAP